MGTFIDYIETHISAYDADRMHERLSIDFPCEDGRIKAVVARDKTKRSRNFESLLMEIKISRNSL